MLRSRTYTGRAARLGVLAAVVPTLALVAACGGSGGASAAGKINVTATDSSCKPTATTATAGATTFSVKNSGGKVTELYVYAPGDRVVGEVEQIGPGISRDLTVELQQGTYQLACKPGMTGDGIRTAFTVTGAAAAATQTDPRLATAVAQYRNFVLGQVSQLVTDTRAFTDAVTAGDMAKAKALYPTARQPYERIEPIAESFGDLDPRIDAREGDVPDSEFGGYHRLEKALFRDKSLAGMTPVATALMTDVNELKSQVERADLTATSLGNGANELLTEVATTKVTGEEERYSHTDLYDFDANVNGAKQAYLALRPVLLSKNPTLAAQLDTEFRMTASALAPLRRGSGWESYDKVNERQRKMLSDQVDALAEPLSRLTAAVLPS